MSEISTPQGELLIGKVVHGAALNCMIVPADDPDGWYFKQFISTAEVERFALDYNLVIRKESDGANCEEV